MKSTATGMTLPYYAKIKGSKIYHLVNVHSRWRNFKGYDRSNCEAVALPDSDRPIEIAQNLPSGAQLCKRCEKLLEKDGAGPFFHDYTYRDYDDGGGEEEFYEDDDAQPTEASKEAQTPSGCGTAVLAIIVASSVWLF